MGGGGKFLWSPILWPQPMRRENCLGVAHENSPPPSYLSEFSLLNILAYEEVKYLLTVPVKISK